jgi:hypothetical protein
MTTSKLAALDAAKAPSSLLSCWSIGHLELCVLSFAADASDTHVGVVGGGAGFFSHKLTAALQRPDHELLAAFFMIWHFHFLL